MARHRRIAGYSPERDCRVCGVRFIAKPHEQSCSAECSAFLARRRQSDRRAREREAFVETVQPRAIFERDKWRCHICKRKLRPERRHPHLRAATLDHLVPLDRGGLHEPANVATACFSCNSAKGNRGGNEQLLLIG
jgi:5-methylcytosine-specific restriction endonuclease McrA